MKLLTILSLVFAAVATALTLRSEDPPEAIQLPATSFTDNQFQPFSLIVTESCENNVKKVKGVWSSQGFTTEVQLGNDMFPFINLGRGISLHIEWDAAHSWVNFVYGSCGWGLHEFKQCGWCRGSGWSQGLVFCGPGGKRTYKSDCYINMDAQKSTMDAVQTDNKLIARDPSLETKEDVQSSATVADVSQGELSLSDANTDAQKPSKTVVVAPKVIQTATEADPAAVTLILPFHFKLTEYCENGSRKVKGHYSNGNMYADMNLIPGLEVGIDHRVPHYPNLLVGPYDYSTSKLRYTYVNGVIGCQWWDDQTGQSCGECRVGQWTGPTLNCAESRSRVKDMDCSFILGVKS